MSKLDEWAKTQDPNEMLALLALSPELVAERYLNSPGVMPIHPESRCAGERCVYHNPSEHRMMYWPMYVRASGLIERTCEHGTGHPDPDSIVWANRVYHSRSYGLHGCDGCCGQDDIAL